MALPPLATAADLADFGYDEDIDDALLLRASVRVRRYTGQQITPGVSTVTLRASPYQLPQRPVQAVTSVTTEQGAPLPHRLLAWGVLEVPGCGGPIVVEYEHGYAELPEGLVELVCSIASRMANTPAGVHAGARTEQAGGESITWGSDAYGGTTGLTEAERSELDRLLPRPPRTTWLRP